MIGQHLSRIGPRVLSIWVSEIGKQIVQRRPKGFFVPTEFFHNRPYCCLWAADVVLLQHKRNVVPVLRVPAGSDGSALGEQEASNAGHVDFDGTLFTIDKCSAASSPRTPSLRRST